MMPAPRAAGFSTLELLIGLAILGILIAVGLPSMNNWLMSAKVSGAAEFYSEGFKLARSQAVMHNAASRITLDDNAVSGQMDWQVDICFPTATVPCNATSGNWSTPATPAANDPEGSAGFKSVLRSADSLPSTKVMAETLSPPGATDIYFTSVGWVDTGFSPRLAQIQLAPAAGNAGAFPTVAVAVTLAGAAAKCSPTAPAHDSRACPP